MYFMNLYKKISLKIRMGFGLTTLLGVVSTDTSLLRPRNLASWKEDECVDIEEYSYTSHRVEADANMQTSFITRLSRFKAKHQQLLHL